MSATQTGTFEAIRALVSALPPETLRIVATKLEQSPTLAEAKLAIGRELPHPHYRAQALDFFDAIARQPEPLAPAVLAVALLTAAHMDETGRHGRSVELVWTGPESDTAPFRHTEQAILQILDSAMERITLVSYAVYHIPRIRAALVRAAQRGVRIQVIVETPNETEGQNEYSTLQALGHEVAACALVYYWPRECRQQDASGRMGILHVKCAVADGRWLFLSSANLTEYAFTTNMELGVLITGGVQPRDVEEHFDRLIALGVLRQP